MPLSHLTLTVTHLPTSTSFFLSCLQPLGYQFIGRHDDYIGFGQEREQPADFWITEQKPGSPAGAIHVAFPAPTKDSVGDFFICALKAGGKIHGEPKTRDPVSGYHSAAVIDYDGNSIEAVYRPGHSTTTARSESRGPAMALLENGSVASKATTRVNPTKPESVAPYKSARVPTDVGRGMPQSGAARETPSSGPTYVIHTREQPQQPQKVDDGSTAKTLVGALFGAAAGAAIAYTMVKDDSKPSQPRSPSQQRSVTREIIDLTAPSQDRSPVQVQAREPAFAQQDQQTVFKAIEPPPPASSYHSRLDAATRPMPTRSVSSKNPHASTIIEGSEYRPPPNAPGSGFVYEYEPGRRSSSGSVYSTTTAPRDIPLRAIEYPPPMERSKSFPCNPSTLISSFVDNTSRNMDEVSMHSSSTVRPSKSGSYNQSHHYQQQPQFDNGSYHTTSSRRSSSHHSHSSRQYSHHHHHHHHHKSSQAGSSAPSSTHTARHIPLPTSTDSRSIASMSSYRSANPNNNNNGSGSSSKSNHSATRHVPLPESPNEKASTVFLDANGGATTEAEPFMVTPDDSISQLGNGNGDGDGTTTRRPSSQASYSPSQHHSHKSRRSNVSAANSHHSAATTATASNKHGSSSRIEEPVRPSDSISQVSSNASQKTVRAVPVPVSASASASASRSPSLAGGSRVGAASSASSSRRGSQAQA